MTLRILGFIDHKHEKKILDLLCVHTQLNLLNKHLIEILKINVNQLEIITMIQMFEVVNSGVENPWFYRSQARGDGEFTMCSYITVPRE